MSDYEEIREEIAKWLFNHRNSLPRQLFYSGWEDEIKASPFTEQEYLKLANEFILSIPRLALIDKDQSLPKNPQEIISSSSQEKKLVYLSYGKAQNDMLKAGLIKATPLSQLGEGR